MGKVAYSQWIKLQKEKDKLLLKQKQREEGECYSSNGVHDNQPLLEQAKLDQQQCLENQKKVQEAYENWKTQKNLEWQLTQQVGNNSMESVKSNSS